MNDNSQKILIVDDEKSVRDYLASVCRSLGYEVATAHDRPAMHCKLKSHAPSIILLDLQMPDFDGIHALKLVKDECSDATVVLVGGNNPRRLTLATQLGEILDLKMGGTLLKPVMIGAIRQKLAEISAPSTSISYQDLQAGISNCEIRPVYQPKIARQISGRWSITEVECLARWYRDDSLKILPSQFIELAEQYGLLSDLTRSILRQVVRQLRKWDDRNLQVTAAVNISPSLLTNRSFPDELQSLMQEHGLGNERMTLELTESAAMQNADLALEILSDLRNRGFGLAIDDFGTGYSSLEQLYRLPFNELKVDRFLVRELHNSQQAAEIVEAIIALGHRLDLSVCAEGVESLQVLSHLIDAGCDKFQGYFIGRPASADALEQRAREFEQTGLAAGWREAQRDTSRSDRKPGSGSSLPLLIL